MGFFDKISKGINSIRSEGSESNNQPSENNRGAILYGENKQDGDHDHRRNRGGDRTPAQKKADRSKKKTG